MHLIDTDIIISTITIAEVYKNIYPTEYTNTEEILNKFESYERH